ncbi:MAG: PorT family protein [bacterium]|nr:PorT family protein [bacterium]
MNTNKTQFMTVMAALVCCLVATAGEAVELEEPRSGLEFRIDSNFRLASFEGSAISWKRVSSPDRGWRIGLSPVVEDDEQDRHDQSYSRNMRYACEISATRLFLSPFRDRTRFYWGAGPLVGIDYEESEHTRSTPGEAASTSRWISRSWYLGVGAVIGIEYFFAPDLSLMGEYGLEVRYLKSMEDRYTKVDHRIWRVTPDQARLGLSVLF